MDKNRPNIVIVVVILWFIACFFFYIKQGSEVVQLQLTDPDDYMRLVQVSRWLNGASWYDVSQPRMNPSEGVEMPWNRMADIPIASVIAALQTWIGRENATIVVAFVVPALLLLGLLVAACWFEFSDGRHC